MACDQAYEHVVEYTDVYVSGARPWRKLYRLLTVFADRKLEEAGHANVN